VRIISRVVLGVLAGALTTGVAMAGQSAGGQDARTTSRTDTAKAVREDLAKRLKVAVDEIEVIAQSDETWPDANLGCPGRKPLDEPAPTPGYAFTLAHAGRRFVYHSDRRGRFRRCETEKPIAPIVR
jgi:hypothetical protein